MEKNPIAITSHAAKSSTKPTTTIVKAAPTSNIVDPVLSKLCLDSRASMPKVNLNNKPDINRNKNMITHANRVPKLPTTLTTG